MDASASTRSQQYLTFTLDGEHYAVEIERVREVLEFTGVNKVPRTPDFLRGMINLRGDIVPVVDLRLKLGLSPTERTIDTCVVITEVTADGEPLVLGALADSVQEVIELDPAAIAPPPRMGARVDTAFIRGMGRREDQFLVILDIERVLAEDGLRALTEPLGAGVPPGAAPDGAGAERVGDAGLAG
ncbi:chemotaxis protein CheW [Anaeromyxobacter sp. Red801]|uniref:chemotaxis protein CheW n=1 Tax=Anaeromyxobacter sp. Red801 TaxID=3411632 RepID=UPI003B9E8C4A